MGGQTALLNGPAVTVSNTVVNLTPSGVVVSPANGGPASIFAIPTIASQPNAGAPTPIATVAGQVIAAAPGASTVMIGGQVVTSGQAAVTIAGSNNVASLGAAGLVVMYPGGAVSTFAVPPPVPTPAPAGAAVVGTVAGIPITASPGASEIAIAGQTVSLGGSPITIDGNNIVSLGANGIIVQMPGGGVSTIALAAAGGVAGTVAGIPITASAGASTIVIGGQTVTLGGAPITVANNNVVSLGASGLVVQMPGGGVSTIALPAGATISTSAGIASIIASSTSFLLVMRCYLGILTFDS